MNLKMSHQVTWCYTQCLVNTFLTSGSGNILAKTHTEMMGLTQERTHSAAQSLKRVSNPTTKINEVIQIRKKHHFNRTVMKCMHWSMVGQSLEQTEIFVSDIQVKWETFLYF